MKPEISIIKWLLVCVYVCVREREYICVHVCLCVCGWGCFEITKYNNNCNVVRGQL